MYSNHIHIKKNAADQDSRWLTENHEERFLAVWKDPNIERKKKRIKVLRIRTPSLEFSWEKNTRLHKLLMKNKKKINKLLPVHIEVPAKFR